MMVGGISLKSLPYPCVFSLFAVIRYADSR